MSSIQNLGLQGLIIMDIIKLQAEKRGIKVNFYIV